MQRIIKKFKKFRKKEENNELVKHSLVSLFVRMGGAAAAFFMNIVVARYLGATEAGYFFLAVTTATLLATIGRVGADQTIMRFVSVLGENKEWNKLHAVMRKILLWSGLPLTIVTVFVCLFAKQIAVSVFSKPEMQGPLIWTALSMPFYAAYNIHGMALQGRRKVLVSVSSLKIITPLVLMILIFIFHPVASRESAIYYLVACVVNFAFGHFWWRRNVPPATFKETFDSKELWKSCGPLWIVAIMNVITTWGGQFIAGIYLPPQEVAQLAVSRNTTVLVSFILLAVNNVSAPRFAIMYNQGKMKELKNYARNTTRIMTLAALPITLLLWIFPEYILSLFGKGFIEGAWLLRILALGQFFSVISGSVGYLLNMTGHEKDMRNVMTINAIMGIILAFILTPLYGAIGSATATAIAIASTNLMAVRMVKKRLGFSTISILGFK
ncbi:MAG: oligosaccharide flippase family protein [Bacteroidota bacterium]